MPRFSTTITEFYGILPVTFFPYPNHIRVIRWLQLYFLFIRAQKSSNFIFLPPASTSCSNTIAQPETIRISRQLAGATQVTWSGIRAKNNPGVVSTMVLLRDFFVINSCLMTFLPILKDAVIRPIDKAGHSAIRHQNADFSSML